MKILPIKPEEPKFFKWIFPFIFEQKDKSFDYYAIFDNESELESFNTQNIPEHTFFKVIE